MESMEEIYQNHSKKVYTFLLSKTCNHELAEELTQETFFCAVNSINKFKGNSSVLTWLCGIAQNLWLKYLRDNKSFEDLSNYEDMLTISSAEDELFIQWENVEILKSLHNLDDPSVYVPPISSNNDFICYSSLKSAMTFRSSQNVQEQLG